MRELDELLAEQAQGSGDMAEMLLRISHLLPTLPTKPILKSQLGAMGFALASRVVLKSALYEISYLVVHSETYLFLGDGMTKGAALSAARQAVATLGVPRVHALTERLMRERQEKAEAKRIEIQAQSRREQEGRPVVRSIPKRRQQIFDASGGKCHYCATPLDLTGSWHIEHKMPKALLGGDEPTNLVASCVPCNASKRDKTDQEFFAIRRAAA